MRIFVLIAVAMFLAGCGKRNQSIVEARTTVRPQSVAEKMDTFWLRDSPLLKGFVASKEERVAPIYENPPYATGVVNARYFRGWTEIRYSVLLFPDEKSLSKWDKLMATMVAGWFSPLKIPKDKQGVRRIRLGGVYRQGKAQPSASVVNRILIVAYPVQHKAQGALSDKEFIRLSEKITAELIFRAKNLPVNRN